MYSIAHVGIRCRSLEQSLQFYVGALGGRKGREYRMPSGSHLIFVEFDDFCIELICKPSDDRTPGTNHLALSVPSMTDALARLNANSFPVSADSVSPMGKSAKNCFIKGPDGEIIELCEGNLE